MAIALAVGLQMRNKALASTTTPPRCLAWNCFKTLYVLTQATATRKLSQPDAETWASIAKLYSAERQAQIAVIEPQSSPETLEKWLLASAKAFRTYLYPSCVSINTPKPGREIGSR
jgi:hypothetical protein